jgi:hypothetical protein
MEKQNITLSLPKEILKKGKMLAAKKGYLFKPAGQRTAPDDC